MNSHDLSEPPVCAFGLREFFHNQKSEQSVLLPLRLVKQASCRNGSGIQLRHSFNVIIRESG
jgi:hypothetical protein